MRVRTNTAPLVGLDALPQRSLQVGRAPMFFEQIQECFVGEFLKVLHAVVCEEIKSMPRLVVELNTFTGHRRFFANIGVDILSTIGSPECSMEQIAVSGIYGTGPVRSPALLRNGSGGGAACEGWKMTDYVTLPTWADTEHLFAVVETHAAAAPS
jgi:hypothetical protein